MFRIFVALAILLSSFAYGQDSRPGSANASAEERADNESSSSVPLLIRFTERLTDSQGRPRSGIAGLTLGIFREEEGGTPLWMESQNVQADSSGRYVLLIGANSARGVPLDIFASGEARWIGVLSDEDWNGKRTLLISVPYALKAADSDTLGGKPATAFVLADQWKPQSATGDQPQLFFPPDGSWRECCTGRQFVSTAESGPSLISQARSGPPFKSTRQN